MDFSFSGILDSWFGQDPGYGDVVASIDRQAGYEEKGTEQALKTIEDTVNKVIGTYTQQLSDQLKYYNENVSAGKSAYEAMNLSAQQTAKDYAEKGIGALSDIEQGIMKYLSPYADVGKVAAARIGGDYGAPTAADIPKFQGVSPDDVRNSPEYKSKMDSMNKNIDAWASKYGFSTDVELLRQQKENEIYNDVSNRLYSQASDTYNRRVQGFGLQQGLSSEQFGRDVTRLGIGQNAAQTLAGQASTTGANVANIYGALGSNLSNLQAQQGLQALQTGQQVGGNLANLYGAYGQSVAGTQGAAGSNVATLQSGLQSKLGRLAYNTGEGQFNLTSAQNSADMELIGKLLGMYGTKQGWFTPNTAATSKLNLGTGGMLGSSAYYPAQ